MFIRIKACSQTDWFIEPQCFPLVFVDHYIIYIIRTSQNLANVHRDGVHFWVDVFSSVVCVYMFLLLVRESVLIYSLT